MTRLNWNVNAVEEMRNDVTYDVENENEICVAEVIFVWVEPILVMVTCVACTETIVAFCCKKKRVGANEIESVFFAHDCATSIWSETEIVIGKQRT